MARPCGSRTRHIENSRPECYLSTESAPREINPILWEFAVVTFYRGSRDQEAGLQRLSRVKHWDCRARQKWWALEMTKAGKLCAVLCCALLCSAVLCCALLCHAVRTVRGAGLNCCLSNPGLEAFENRKSQYRRVWTSRWRKLGTSRLIGDWYFLLKAMGKQRGTVERGPKWEEARRREAAKCAACPPPRPASRIYIGLSGWRYSVVCTCCGFHGGTDGAHRQERRSLRAG